jgi:protein-disulfide isomerase
MSRRAVNPRYQKRRKSKFSSLLPVIIVVAAAFIILGFLIIPSLIKPTTQSIVSDKTSLGVATAPVKVEEFGDYQCPACGAFFVNIEPGLVSNYINTGKVYFTFTPFSFIGQESFQAAQAAYCAMDQNKFWDFHDMLYNNQKGENTGGFSNANLEGFAQKLDLDMTQFKTCFEGGKYNQQVQDNVVRGNSLLIQSTPSFLVDGKLVFQESLIATIDAELKAKGQ